jgi:hypothetical protein
MAKKLETIWDQVEKYSKNIDLTRIDTNVGRCYTPTPENKETWKPSVTTIENIISKGIIFERWIANFGGYDKVQEYVGRKADDGSCIHSWIDTLVLTGELDISEETPNYMKKYIQSFEQWWNDTDLQVVASELQLHSDKCQFSGTADFIGYIDGKLSLVDYKTGNEYPTTHSIQLTCYKEIFDSLFPDHKIEKLYCLYVKSGWRKKPNYKLREYKYDSAISKALTYLWNFNNTCNKTQVRELKEKDLPNKFKIKGAIHE